MKFSDGFDISAFRRGINCNIYNYFGSHRKSTKVIFRVWAPHADRIFVTGDFNYWSEHDPMTKISDSGIWECSIDYHTVKSAPLYKYKIIHGTQVLYKADPFGRQMQRPPETATVYYDSENIFNWTDSHWLSMRKKKRSSQPINIYQVHLGSFMRHNDGSYLNYREIAPQLSSYAKKMGYTHIELLPISEHHEDSSLGYDSSCLYAVSSRYGTPEDFKHFVDELHNCGVGVILSYVPSKFAACEHGLSNFDGRPLFECEFTDSYPRANASLQFDLSKNEVRSFLLSNAHYFLREFHIDALRVCQLSSMLYLDHNRPSGSWKPNKHGGNINFEAVEFIKQLNATIRIAHPDVFTIADDTGGYKYVTSKARNSLGFDLAWNTKLKQKTLESITAEAPSICGCLAEIDESNITSSEILPLSHDEFSYPHSSLLSKMQGEYAMKFAAHRAFTLYTMSLPTKKLSFMSCEFGQFAAWSHNSTVEWFMLDYDMHNKLHRFTSDINALYLSKKQFWESSSKESLTKLVHDSSTNNLTVFRRTDSEGTELMVIVSFSQKNSSLTIKDIDGRYRPLISTESSIYGGNKANESTFYPSKQNQLRIDLAPFECIILEKDT